MTTMKSVTGEAKTQEKLFWEAVTAMRELAAKAATSEIRSCVAMGEHVQTYAEKTGIPLRTATDLLAAEVGPSSATIWRYVKISRTFPLKTLEPLLQEQDADAESPLSLKLMYECARAGGEDPMMSLELLKTAQEEHLSANDVAELTKGESETSEADEPDETDDAETEADVVTSDPLTRFVDFVWKLGDAAAVLEVAIDKILPDDLAAACKAAHRAQRAIDSLCRRLDAKRIAPMGDVSDPAGGDLSLAAPTSPPPMLLEGGTP